MKYTLSDQFIRIIRVQFYLWSSLTEKNNKSEPVIHTHYLLTRHVYKIRVQLYIYIYINEKRLIIKGIAI